MNSENEELFFSNYITLLKLSSPRVDQDGQTSASNKQKLPDHIPPHAILRSRISVIIFSSYVYSFAIIENKSFMWI